MQEMWAYICPELLKAIEAEPESALVSEHLNSMARCVEILGVGCLNEPSMEALVKIMVSLGQAQIGQWIQRKNHGFSITQIIREINFGGS